MSGDGLARCFRCGNVWTPRRQPPRICPVCKSRLWHVPVIRPFPKFDPASEPWTKVVVPNRKVILETAARNRAHNPRVFGSVRRGTTTSGSDLDLLVTFEPDATLIDHANLRRELEDKLGRKVDVVSDRGIFWLMRAQVLAEAEPV